jgi:DNA-binding transcriptional LysR family regulator
MLELRDIKMVSTIAECGSLVRASRILGIAQPALTRRLAATESLLKGPLFVRHRRGVVPTDLCRTILSEGMDILLRVERMAHHAHSIRGDQKRQVTMAAGAFAAETVGMPAVARLLATVPDVRFKVLAGNWSDVPDRVREREASIGLIDSNTVKNAADFDVELLGVHRGAFVARAGHALARRDAVSLADMLEWPMILPAHMPDRMATALAAARQTARERGKAYPSFPAIVHDNVAVSVAAVAASDAVTPATLTVLEPFLRTGDIVVLPWHEPWAVVQFCVLTPRGYRPNADERALLDAVRERDAEAVAIGHAMVSAVPRPS